MEIERRRRIRLAVAAYAYEFLAGETVMSDAEFDKLSYEIDLSIDTGNKKMDKFFREHFKPFTGQWIHQHPDKSGLHVIALMWIGWNK